MTQKAEQLLNITPESELVFKGTFLTPVTTQILLENPTSMTMAFKIKTTTPKQYCVKPNFGFVKPGETVSISIILQPFKYSPNEKYRHKFMVQSVIQEDDSTGQVQWEKFAASDLMDSKLLCVFEHSDDRGQTAATDAGDATTADSSAAGVVSSLAPLALFGSPEKKNDEMHYRAAAGSSSSSSSMMISGGSGSGSGGGGAGSGDVRSQSTNGALFDFSECHSKTAGDNDHYKTVDNRMRHDSVAAKDEELNSLREELALMKREQRKLMVELSKARSKDHQNSQRMETSNCVMNAPVQYVVCAIAICLLSYLFGRYF